MSFIHTWIEECLKYVHYHPHMGELFAFVVAFAESLPLVGTIVPGSITMTAVGAMIGTGNLPGAITLMWASLGAFTGDSIGFWCGTFFKESIRNIWPFRNKPHWIDRSETFFKKHGGKSIIIGRFVGPARSTVPLVAGLLKMRWLQFVCAAIPSAVLWAIAYTIPGILIGAVSIELPPRLTTKFLIIGALIIIGLWLVFWIMQISFRYVVRFSSRCIDKLWSWLNQHHASKPLIKWITNQQDPTNHHQLARVIICCFFGFLFLISYFCAAFHSSYTKINLPIFYLFQSIRTPRLDTIMVLLTLLAKPIVILMTSVIIAIGLSIKRQWRAATHVIILTLVTAAAVTILKHMFHSPRPTGFTLVAKSSSLPSGHTTLSLVLYGFLAFLTNELLGKKGRWISYLCASIVITLFAFSRLYLGAHWLTDIITSVFLGLCLLLAAIISYRRLPHKHSTLHCSKTYWFCLITISIIVIWGAYTSMHYYKSRRRYTPINKTYIIKAQSWWDNPLQYTTVYRNNRFGHPIQPLNIQWNGRIDNIQKILQQHGWQPLDQKYYMRNTIRRLMMKNPEYHMPIFPSLYHNQKPVLVMFKHFDHNKDIIELYLWPTRVFFSNTESRLWIGTIDKHLPPHHLINLKSYKYLSYAEDNALTGLQKATAKDFQSKILHLKAIKVPKDLVHYHWNKKVLLLRPTKAQMAHKPKKHYTVSFS